MHYLAYSLYICKDRPNSPSVGRGIPEKEQEDHHAPHNTKAAFPPTSGVTVDAFKPRLVSVEPANESHANPLIL